MKVQFYRRRSLRGRGVWRWRIVAGNGRRVAASTEGYFNQKEARDNFAQVTSRDPQTGELLLDVRQLSADGRRWNVWSVETLNK